MGTLIYPKTLTALQPENVNDLNSNLTAVASVLNGNVDANNITAGSVTDAKLASPNNSTYKTVFTAGTMAYGLSTATAYYLDPTGGLPHASPYTPGAYPPVGFYFNSADYTVSGLTAYYRLRLTYASNATALGTTATAVLSSATVAGGAGSITFTESSVDTATASVATPSASTIATGVSSATALPASGFWLPRLSFSANQAANHLGLAVVQVQVKNA